MRGTTKFLLGGVTLLLLMSLAPQVALCVDDNSAKEPEIKEKIEGGEGVSLEMEDVEIRGELERPEVFYIIPRRKARMDLGNLQHDYHDAIMEPLLPMEFNAVYGKGGK